MREQAFDLALERRAVGKIHQPDRAAAYLVLVGGADAAPRRADAQSRARRFFADGVELAVQRQDQRRVLGNAQIVGSDRDVLLLQRGDLIEQGLRIEHHAVADDRQFPGPHHARGQQRKLIGDAVDDQRVAGIVAALEADDDIGLLGQPIDDLAFALVAPLGADHDNICHEVFVPNSLLGVCLYRMPAAADCRRPPPIIDAAARSKLRVGGQRDSSILQIIGFKANLGEIRPVRKNLATRVRLASHRAVCRRFHRRP